MCSIKKKMLTFFNLMVFYSKDKLLFLIISNMEKKEMTTSYDAIWYLISVIYILLLFTQFPRLLSP